MNRSSLGRKGTMWIPGVSIWRWLLFPPIALITLVVVSAYLSPGAQKEKPQKERPRQVGGGVSGSLYVEVRVKTNGKASQEQIVLPDIKVYLRNKATGKDSPPAVTDLFGRYT